MTRCQGLDVMSRFVAGTASRHERRDVVRHLLGGCGACAARLRFALRPPVAEGAYDDAFARLIEAVPAQAGCP